MNGFTETVFHWLHITWEIQRGNSTILSYMYLTSNTPQKLMVYSVCATCDMHLGDKCVKEDDFLVFFAPIQLLYFLLLV